MQKVTTADLSAFQSKLQAFVKNYHQKTGNVGAPPAIVIEPLTEGRKFARIVLAVYADQRSAYGFIDLATGNLLKSASWKAPAKHPRGNIFAENPLAGCGPYSMAYLKN